MIGHTQARAHPIPAPTLPRSARMPERQARSRRLELGAVLGNPRRRHDHTREHQGSAAPSEPHVRHAHPQCLNRSILGRVATSATSAAAAAAAAASGAGSGARVQGCDPQTVVTVQELHHRRAAEHTEPESESRRSARGQSNGRACSACVGRAVLGRATEPGGGRFLCTITPGASA